MKSKWILFYLLLFIPQIGHGAACWIFEIDPYTQQPFASFDRYQEVKRDWQEIKPKAPTIGELLSTFATLQRENSWVNRLATGGAKHCFLGCRISQNVGWDAAHFAGWFKEWLDLRDCRLRTHFEERDLDETLYGASIANGVKTRQGCYEACQHRFLH